MVGRKPEEVMNLSGYFEYRTLDDHGRCLDKSSTFDEALAVGRAWKKNHPHAGWFVIDGLDSQGNRVQLHREWREGGGQ